MTAMIRAIGDEVNVQSLGGQYIYNCPEGKKKQGLWKERD